MRAMQSCARSRRSVGVGAAAGRGRATISTSPRTGTSHCLVSTWYIPGTYLAPRVFYAAAVARAHRSLIAGGIYHVFARGNRREPLFRTDYDFELFLVFLDDEITTRGW